ncbi:hypothetical protein [Saccharospirillum salsuginis]|nr:hypothetical protein [Saccharospirillum salsuginis]
MLFKTRLAVAVIAGLTFGLGACSDPQPTLPVPPPILETTKEYPFGTLTGSLDTRYWTQVWDRAVATFGEVGMRLERYVMPTDTSWQRLQEIYAEKLAAREGWRPADDLTFGTNEHAWSFAYRRDDHFVALVGLRPQHSEGGIVPVNVMTNLPLSSEPK